MNRCESLVWALLVLFSLPAITAQLGHANAASEAANVVDVVPEIQPLTTIQNAVESFVKSVHESDRRISVKVKKLDSRLRLAFCQGPLKATWSPGSRMLGRVTTQIECSTPKRWRVHVQATVTMEGFVWILARGVRREEVLTRDVLVKKQVTLGAGNAAYISLGTPVTDIEPWLGFAFSQRVNAGKVLNDHMLEPARLISKGESVVIRHRSQGLELQTRGVALKDGAALEQTQVRNSSSGKIIDVVVVDQGTVEILQ